MCCPQPQRAVHPLLSAPSLSTHLTATAETRKLLYFSKADRRRACPYPRNVSTTASADRTSASTLRRRCRRLIPRALAWSKHKSFWSLFGGRTSSGSLSVVEVEGNTCRRAFVISWVHPLGNRPHANPSGGSLVRNIKHFHF